MKADVHCERSREIGSCATIKGCELPDEIVYCSNPEQPISRTDPVPGPPTVISTVPNANETGAAP